MTATTQHNDPFDLAAAIARLNAAARARWQTDARGYRWTFTMRLSFRRGVSVNTAEHAVEAWAARLQRRLPGVAIFVGLHTDTERVHVHALLYVPHRNISQTPGPWTALARTWIQGYWRHGLLWLDEYRPFRVHSSADPRRHGAVSYLTKEVGTIMQFGTPVAYTPRRRR